jgi:hypothetical protein
LEQGEYATSGVSSPTTFPWALSGVTDQPYAEAGIALNPSSAPMAVGGEIIPINLVQVLMPWLALVAVLGTVSVWTLLVKRRRESA